MVCSVTYLLIIRIFLCNLEFFSILAMFCTCLGFKPTYNRHTAIKLKIIIIIYKFCSIFQFKNRAQHFYAIYEKNYFCKLHFGFLFEKYNSRNSTAIKDQYITRKIIKLCTFIHSFIKRVVQRIIKNVDSSLLTLIKFYQCAIM